MPFDTSGLKTGVKVRVRHYVYTSSFYRKVTDIETYRLDTDIRKAYSAQSTLAIFRNRMSVSVCMSVCL
jgi:hypothetical protein